MNIFKSGAFLFLEINMQEIKDYNINIHNILTSCEYCTNSSVKLILKEYIDEDIDYFNIISSSFCDKILTLKILAFPEIKSVYKYTKYLKNSVNNNVKHKYVNVKHSKEKALFSNFYEYINNSIYSKYISIKNGIIFIKDKSKEKYILNYISEFE